MAHLTSPNINSEPRAQSQSCEMSRVYHIEGNDRPNDWQIRFQKVKIVSISGSQTLIRIAYGASSITIESTPVDSSSFIRRSLLYETLGTNMFVQVSRGNPNRLHSESTVSTPKFGLDYSMLDSNASLLSNFISHFTSTMRLVHPRGIGLPLG